MAWTRVAQANITTSNATSTFTWSGLTGYSHYICLISARTSYTSSNLGEVEFDFNGDSADYHRGWRLNADSSNPFNNTNTYVDGANPEVRGPLGTDVGSNTGYGTAEVFLPFADKSDFPRQTFVHGANAAVGVASSEQHMFLWRTTDYNTSATVQSLTITTSAGQYLQAGSKFTLYGF